MQQVRQINRSGAPPGGRRRARRRGRRAGAVAAVVLVGLLGSACGLQAPGEGGDGTVPHSGQQAEASQIEKAERAAEQAGPAGSLAAYVERVKRNQKARAVAAQKWGLAKTPLPAPQPPASKPFITTRKGFEVEGGASLPPVFTTVPVKEKVVFLTIDDGVEKDPDFLRMMDELQIPYSAFLSDYVIDDDYGYFKRMRDQGAALHNHTLNHRYMPGLSYDAQEQEICGQQEKLEKLYGKRPPLFRPPYGNYNGDTLRAAQSCGVKAVPLWAAEAFPDHMEWREWDRDLHPGDIILTHFRGADDWKGSMTDMVRQVMKVVTDKGYAVARLEDYV
ncbi:polysaccharide deacetylase family protein [Streptomyces sp. NPDC047315]|uniref:polysaccharide deacetylase family protein n=1 Tax=Streptomyces sp. NPDC047315 TaxID=3155142 RepID=UPI0033D0C757